MEIQKLTFDINKAINTCCDLYKKNNFEKIENDIGASITYNVLYNAGTDCPIVTLSMRAGNESDNFSIKKAQTCRSKEEVKSLFDNFANQIQ